MVGFFSVAEFLEYSSLGEMGGGINTVGLDGKKIHMDRSFMKKVFEPTLNKLAEKYGFTPNVKWRT